MRTEITSDLFGYVASSEIIVHFYSEHSALSLLRRSVTRFCAKFKPPDILSSGRSIAITTPSKVTMSFGSRREFAATMILGTIMHLYSSKLVLKTWKDYPMDVGTVSDLSLIHI